MSLQLGASLRVLASSHTGEPHWEGKDPVSPAAGPRRVVTTEMHYENGTRFRTLMEHYATGAPEEGQSASNASSSTEPVVGNATRGDPANSTSRAGWDLLDLFPREPWGWLDWWPTWGGLNETTPAPAPAEPSQGTPRGGLRWRWGSSSWWIIRIPGAWVDLFTDYLPDGWLLEAFAWLAALVLPAWVTTNLPEVGSALWLILAISMTLTLGALFPLRHVRRVRALLHHRPVRVARTDALGHRSLHRGMPTREPRRGRV